MAFTGSALAGEVGLKVLLSPCCSNVILRSACTVIGVGFPVYSTFKAIKTKDPEKQEQWLTYWAVYGCFSVVEYFSDKAISWAPFYYHVKFVFLVWLQLPDNYGARHLFSQYLEPFLVKHQDWLDRIVDTSRNDMNNFICAHHKEFGVIVQTVRKTMLSAYQAMEGWMHTSKLDWPSPLTGQNKDSGLLPEPSSEADHGWVQVSGGESSSSSK